MSKKELAACASKAMGVKPGQKVSLADLMRRAKK